MYRWGLVFNIFSYHMFLIGALIYLNLKHLLVDITFVVILLIVFLVLCSFVFSRSFSYDLMTFVLYLYSLLFIFCVSVIDLFVYGHWGFIYNNLCVSKSILSWCSYEFRCILKALYFYSPVPRVFCFEIIFVIF